ncbi:shikimate dehydrogenase family protein [Methylobacterium isbiliense]|jgi:shikimate dehydrogenase|uniref:shikimate dehydrogenase (NADP(+)) n=1 Tax=Methylobacterium isbiliense TaxID=315478 RepID=A0ABQ4SII2_9HYPH|nr:shikimate dehydrogenase [Methylobacterium isbiliense]MDN3624208.1 shikimate dehydrogenase [Methylobacterium isbiliense]GJE02942.1 Shikimate dehydrogenase (NADP(+)) [Methylobacterium isbiliense]
MRAITGTTRVYGILADPIYHVKTPEVMNALFARAGVDGVLVPFHVAPDGLAAAVEGLRRMHNFGGFIATVPHKTAMLDLCDEVSPDARGVGAVNCVRRDPDGRMIGTMLDGLGFVAALRASGEDPAGKRVCLAGAGGAASAIAFALAGAGIAHLTVVNRTPARTDGLLARLAVAYPGLSLATDPGGGTHDILVNGTSLGMRADDPLPLDPALLAARPFVAEAIMEPEITPLLAAAEAAGCRVQRGRPMLDCQIVLMAQHMGALQPQVLNEGAAR